MTEQEENLPLVPLEGELRDDADGHKRDALLQRIEAHAAELKRAMDAGVPPQEFTRLQGLHEALEAAARVVVVGWRRFNPAQA